MVAARIKFNSPNIYLLYQQMDISGTVILLDFDADTASAIVAGSPYTATSTLASYYPDVADIVYDMYVWETYSYIFTGIY